MTEKLMLSLLLATLYQFMAIYESDKGRGSWVYVVPSLVWYGIAVLFVISAFFNP